jgi:hypothetical protein
MAAASVLYTGAAGDTAAIITAVGTEAFSTLAFLLSADGKGLIILKQGS